MATYNIHAGHAAVGHGAIGAVGILNESIEDRYVKDRVIQHLKNAGNVVYDCTEDNGSQSQVLNSIVRKCNSHKVDLDVSIHFNSGVNRPYCDGVTTGTEVLCYNPQSTAAVSAGQRICAKIAGFGYKNRGIKYRRDLAVLARTNSQALLIEVCFVDDGDDTALYNAKKDEIAKAIAEGIMNRNIPSTVPVPKPKNVDRGVYRLYNPNGGYHFYTLSATERDNLMSHGWGYEGVTWKAPKEGDNVYRLYNPNSGQHFFTASAKEKDDLVSKGWKCEGVAFKSGGNTKVFRIYNPNSGEHFYTPADSEKNNLVSLGWRYEGVAFYGYL